MTKKSPKKPVRRVREESWTTIRSRFEGDTLNTIFRFCLELPPPKQRLKFPNKVILRWRYKARKDGMPFKAAIQRMNEFEDAMDALLPTLAGGPAQAIHVAVLTGNGRRTWRYFAKDIGAFVAAAKPVMDSFGPEGPEVFRREADPSWDALSDLLGMLC